MPRSCSVPGCRSNYRSKDGYVSVFKFPEDPVLKSKWEESIHRKDFIPGKYSGVCVRHFEESFIIREESFVNKVGETITVKRDKLTLRPDAYPTILYDGFKHINKSHSKRRKTFEFHQTEQLAIDIAKSIATFQREQQANCLPTLEDIEAYFCAIKTEDWTHVVSDRKTFFFKVSHNKLGLPYIAAGISVTEEKNFDVFFENVRCNKKQLQKRGIQFNAIESKSDVRLLLNVCDSAHSVNSSSPDCMEVAVESLEMDNQVSKTKKRPSLDQPSSTKKSKNTEHEERDVSQKSQIGTESGNMAFVCQKINVVTNEYEAVGMNVTAKLRRMNSIQQIYAESLINKVLTKGLLNKLTENTDIVVSLNFDDRSTAATSTSVSKNGDSS